MTLLTVTSLLLVLLFDMGNCSAVPNESAQLHHRRNDQSERELLLRTKAEINILSPQAGSTVEKKNVDVVVDCGKVPRFAPLGRNKFSNIEILMDGEVVAQRFGTGGRPTLSGTVKLRVDLTSVTDGLHKLQARGVVGLLGKSLESKDITVMVMSSPTIAPQRAPAQATTPMMAVPVQADPPSPSARAPSNVLPAPNVALPTKTPTKQPTKAPTKQPTKAPTKQPTKAPTKQPTKAPTKQPTKAPTKQPTKVPTKSPTKVPTKQPTKVPTKLPTKAPTKQPTKVPTTKSPTTKAPANGPTKAPANGPTKAPANGPTKAPANGPTKAPANGPTKAPANGPTKAPAKGPTKAPANGPTKAPGATPTAYQVDLQLIGLPSADQAFFTGAKARWEQIVKGDVPDISLAGATGSTNPVYKNCILPAAVDDLHICAVYTNIDGPSNILAYAGPYFYRSSPSFLPINGYMAFDTSDLNSLKADGGFGSVIIHEMGHILGIGTMWTLKGIADAKSPPCTYSGVQATNEYKAITGCDQVPLEESQGGQGTLCGHWDEFCLRRELMTGFLNSGVSNPLSRITVGSLQDMGYVVDYSTAESYTSSNVDSFCRCNLRLRREERTIMDMPHGETIPLGGDSGGGRRKMSEETHAAAIEAGQEYLAENALNAPETMPPGVTYVGDQVVSVLVRDTDGSIYSVIVRNEE